MPLGGGRSGGGGLGIVPPHVQDVGGGLKGNSAGGNDGNGATGNGGDSADEISKNSDSGD